MAEPVAFKYRAFISYSHADTTWAKWLHRALESFRIDKDLVGRETSTGPIPRALRPIFRDRDDFTAGHALTDQTLAALDASAALIAICSPSAAKSRYANEEIRLFKSRHPERPVIPLIVVGKPGDPELECFPPALKFKLDAGGNITDEPVELLAADAREQGDGKSLALAKVIAGLLGVSSDDVFRRAERERRRHGRVRNGIIAVLAVLVVTASGSAVYAWQQLKTNEAFLTATLQRATDIVNTAVSQAEAYGVPRKATLALLTQAEGVFDDMALLARPTAALRYRRAVMRIEFARNYAMLGDLRKRHQSAKEAHELLAALASEWPNDLSVAGDLANAYVELGNVFVAQGNLPAALTNYQLSLAIAERLAKADPSNEAWQIFPAIGHERVGDVLIDQNDLAGALKAYQSKHAIMSRLVSVDPENAQWQREFAVSHVKIGDVFLKQGELPAALTSYNEFLRGVERLAKANPHNSARQADLAIANSRIGEALMLQRDYTGALKSFRAAQDIFARSVATDPDNAHTKREHFVTFVRIGRVQALQGDLAGALENYRSSLAIVSSLALADAENAGWQHDLFIAYDSIGEVLHGQGDNSGALAHYKTSLAIAERLARADPGNAGWQRDLGVSYVKTADALAAEGDADAAFKNYKAAHPIFERLAEADPSNALWQRDLASSHGHLATTLVQRGEPQRALEQFRQGRAIAAWLTQQFPETGAFRADLAWFDGEIAKLEPQSAAEPTAVQPEQAAAP